LLRLFFFCFLSASSNTGRLFDLRRALTCFFFFTRPSLFKAPPLSSLSDGLSFGVSMTAPAPPRSFYEPFCFICRRIWWPPIFSLSGKYFLGTSSTLPQYIGNTLIFPGGLSLYFTLPPPLCSSFPCCLCRFWVSLSQIYGGSLRPFSFFPPAPFNCP